MTFSLIKPLRRLLPATVFVGWRLLGSYATFTGLSALGVGPLLPTLLLTLLIQLPLAALMWALARGPLRRALVLATWLRWSARHRLVSREQAPPR